MQTPKVVVSENQVDLSVSSSSNIDVESMIHRLEDQDLLIDEL